MDTPYFVDAKYTMGIQLAGFVMAKGDRSIWFAWAYATTNTESAYPSKSGWDIGYVHFKESAGRPWRSPGDYHPARVDFTTTPQPGDAWVDTQGQPWWLSLRIAGWFVEVQ